MERFLFDWIRSFFVCDESKESFLYIHMLYTYICQIWIWIDRCFINIDRNKWQSLSSFSFDHQILLTKVVYVSSPVRKLLITSTKMTTSRYISICICIYTYKMCSFSPSLSLVFFSVVIFSLVLFSIFFSFLFVSRSYLSFIHKSSTMKRPVFGQHISFFLFLFLTLQLIICMTQRAIDSSVLFFVFFRSVPSFCLNCSIEHWNNYSYSSKSIIEQEETQTE